MSGLVALNQPKPTHVSGTTIDLALGFPGSPSAITHDGDDIGGSDHKLVTLDLQGSVESHSSGGGVGFVQWAHPQVWNAALTGLDPLLVELATCTRLAREEIEQAPRMPGKRKRVLLEACAWAREAVYVAVGHSCSAIKVRQPSKKRLSGGEPRSVDQCKEQMVSNLRSLQAANLHKLASLTGHPAEAQRFLSGFFKRTKDFNIALVDTDSQLPLLPNQSAEVIAKDLSTRTQNSPQPSEAHTEVAGMVSRIRQLGAPREGVDGLPRPPPQTMADGPPLYSLAEAETCLKKISSFKKAALLPLAALKADNPTGRLVSLELCNLSRACRMSPGLWSLRHVAPLHKAGPQTVTQLKNLRPVSRANDLTSLQDSLWLGRCQHFLDRFTGDFQLGGKYDCVAIVVALVLQAQLRQYQGLLTYFLFADLKHAFDVADWNLMLVSCYVAGIVGTEWMLLDDFFRQDHAVVVVGGFLLQVLRFSAGIPQGRRFSMQAFMSSMNVLREIMDAVALTSKTILPTFAREAMEGSWATPLPTPNRVQLLVGPQQVAQVVRGLLQQGDAANARRMAVHCLNNMPCFHERVLCMELLGDACLGPLFFVDDVAAPYPDGDSVEAVLHHGLARFTDVAKATFNFGPQKTATMACFDAPPVSRHTDTYKLLGIEVDNQLTFAKRLDIICAVGKAAFEELFHLAESLGLSIPVEAVEVPRRLEPIVLFGAKVLPLAENAEARLNSLQAHWARAILGTRLRGGISGRLAVAECGWRLRLGTLMMIKAVTFLNKLFLLPSSHPCRQLVTTALSLPCDTWTRAG